MTADGAPVRPPKKRARIVCRRCHSKKIRCDLSRAGGTCSACAEAEETCEFRPSRKGYGRKKSAATRQQSNEISAPDPIRGQQQSVEVQVEQLPSEQHQPVQHQPGPPDTGQSQREQRQTEEEAAEVLLTSTASTSFVRTLLGHQSELHGGKNLSKRPTSQPESARNDVFPALRSYLESYLDFHYTWCPVIDVDDSTTTTGSLLLDHAVAAVASMIHPSLLPGAQTSEEHYERARHLFYSEREHDNLAMVKTALILSGCDSKPLGSLTDSSFWWLGVAIRIAQDLRLHRVPRGPANQQDIGMKRRMWWTMFARERISALCQGRPCVIVEDECTLGPPVEADFPASQSRVANTFIRWVSLCRIMAIVNKCMVDARQTATKIPTREIAASLTSWLQCLPADLQLSIRDAHTAPFVRDVHLLHLPYLTTIQLMYLNTTGQDVPEISVAAVLAAACTARLIGDFLARGCIQTLPEDAGWFITIAVTALLHVRPLTRLSTHAAADIHLLRTALGHLGSTWSSARILANGLDRIIADRMVVINSSGESQSMMINTKAAPLFTTTARTMDDLCADDGVFWSDFFPFATERTSPMVEAILSECYYADLWPPLDLGEYFDDLWNDFIAG